MEFEEIAAQLKGVPYITPSNARYLYDMVLREGIKDVLELGIAFGTATCYMAAAMKKRGSGRIVAVDLQLSPTTPQAEEQIKRFGFQDIVQIRRMQTGYNWFLHDDIARHTANGICTPVYDLCIIDGPKNWTIDSSAFFLADKLLKRDGWMIFDDIHWTYAKKEAKGKAVTDGITIRELSDDERNIPHIREVVELLVKQHPDYGRFIIRDDTDWAIAQKNLGSVKQVEVVYSTSLKNLAKRLLLRAVQR